MKKLITVLAISMFALAAPAQAEVFSFKVFPPNTATDPGTNEGIRVTAAGTFNTVTGDILARGSFTIVDFRGRVIDRGTWKATEFFGFRQAAGGGPIPGEQSGVLDMDVTLSPKGGDPIFDVPMRIVCNLPGFDTGEPAGTTVGDFTVTGGEFTQFNLHQGP